MNEQKPSSRQPRVIETKNGNNARMSNFTACIMRDWNAFVSSTYFSTSSFTKMPQVKCSWTSSPPFQVPKRSRCSTNKTSITSMAEITLTATIERALENEFDGKNISRVTKCFLDAMHGNVLDIAKGTPNHQHATSFIDGLHAIPFMDDYAENDLQWVTHLEKNWQQIAGELATVNSQKNLVERGNNIWAPPVVEAAEAYGPDWKTLVLKDRVWDPVNTKLFPETTRILQDKKANVPAVEAFFARQSPKTGIKLHTDYCNFVLTMHLGLSTPKDQSWIEVAGERRYWADGKALVFNTSFFHQTMNESEDQDRLVLLIRFWHPEVTADERKALSFLFQAVESPDSLPAILKAEKELRKEQQKGFTASGRRSRSAGRGFGA